MRRGFTLLELLTTIGIVVIVAVVLLPNLRGTRSTTELSVTAREIAALLREAQGRAISESSSTTWGVHLENATTTTPFYALFSGTYGTSTIIERNILPTRVRYATSSIARGSSTEIIFYQSTGRPMATATIRLELTEQGTNVTSTTISVNSFGAISF